MTILEQAIEALRQYRAGAITSTQALAIIQDLLEQLRS